MSEMSDSLSSSYVVLDACSTSDPSIICLDESLDVKPRLSSLPIIIPDTSLSEEDDVTIVERSIKQEKDISAISGLGTVDSTDIKPGKELKLPCTPSERECKRRRLNTSLCDVPLASTPLAGSSGAPEQLQETPIPVKYERIRVDLSATKKEQKKLIGHVQKIEENMRLMQEELSKKRKREDKIENDPLDFSIDDETDVLRPVVIDASNVAMNHGNCKVFSCKGISICIQFFMQRGHTKVHALLPQDWKEYKKFPIKDAHLIDELKSRDLLRFTPAGLRGGKRATPYDDRIMLQAACRNGGVIVSNDNYRDLINESAEFKFVIDNRLIKFTFLGNEFLVSKDTYGRNGPELNEILRRPEKISETVPEKLSEKPQEAVPEEAPKTAPKKGPLQSLKNKVLNTFNKMAPRQHPRPEVEKVPDRAPLEPVSYNVLNRMTNNRSNTMAPFQQHRQEVPLHPLPNNAYDREINNNNSCNTRAPIQRLRNVLHNFSVRAPSHQLRPQRAPFTTMVNYNYNRYYRRTPIEEMRYRFYNRY
ncbi:probable ribonuclease ZC3H12C isoform X2 [Lytechinus pictus]